MAKMKIHELAKELEISSKEIIGFLAEQGVEAKSHMSTIEDDMVGRVKSRFGKKAAAAAKPAEEAPAAKAEGTKPAEAKAATESKPAETEAPKKKKSIIIVNNSQNSQSRPSQQGQNGQRPQGQNGQRPQGQNGQRPQGSRPGQPVKPAEPARKLIRPNMDINLDLSHRAEEPKEEVAPAAPVKPAEPQAVKPAETVSAAPAAEVPAASEPKKQDGPIIVRAASEQPKQDGPIIVSRASERQQSERPQGQNGQRPQGQNGQRPQGQNGQRPQGQNGQRPQGQNGQRPQGQGQGRPQGREEGEGGQKSRGRVFINTQGRNDSPRGQRPQGQGQGRPQGERPYGERPAYGQGGQGRPQGQRPYGDRPAYGQGGQGRPQGERPQGGRPSFGQGGEKSGSFQGGQGRPQGGRPMGGGRGGASDAPLASTEKSRDGGKRRQGQERDKRRESYEEQEGQLSKKAGRFIKPEKKPEVEEEQIKSIVLPDTLTLKELADKMHVQPSVIIKKLFLTGKVLTVNSELTYEEAENIAIDFEILCEHEVKVDVIEELLKEEEESEDVLVTRPPVVCVMGHVDHGKTSLLDAIRKTNVTTHEAGGITQAIGAYTVNINNRSITFLDTPGHEAFTAMRMRGANSTDIAILVVAADDGVMPQTIEAINHAKAAGVEIIVAVNKIDKPGANVEKVKQELTEYELVSEDWGGSTIFVPVSAKSGEGIENLLEMVLLTADVLELKANPNRAARGLVIEAELDKGRGPVATILVQKGCLHVGDMVSAGVAYGKVRAMIDDKGHRVKEAGPSVPVEILGLNDVPNAGDVFIAHKNDKEAKMYAETFIAQNKEKLLEETKSKMSLDDLFTQIQAGNLKELNLIIKADVQGSVEAVKTSLLKLSNEEVVVKVIHGGVGAINESDVILASASNAIIIGFNVRPDATAKATAEHEGVDVRLYKVIYQAIEDIEAAMKGMLDPVFEEKVIGHAEVRQIFKASAIGNIAGSFIMDGMFQRGCLIRITREGEQIYEGKLASLKRFKDDVKEVKAGFECGLVFEDFDKMQEFDIVEAYIMVEVPR